MAATTAPVTIPREQPGAVTLLGRSVLAEWTKLRTVRSTIWTLLGTLTVCVGLPFLISFAIINAKPSDLGPDFDAASFSMFGLFLGQLIVGALGVLVISAEYSTGTIRASLSAVPHRLTVLLGKTITFTVALTVLAFVTVFAAFYLVMAVLSTKQLDVPLGRDPATRIVIGGALYLILVGLLGLGIGTILRHTAAGISTVVALLFVLPILGNFLPHSWQTSWVKYLPGQAGGALFNPTQTDIALAPWPGLVVFAIYVLVALVVGGILLVRRDA
jgi:hypothetical protein